MREFGPDASASVRPQIVELATQFFDRVEIKRAVKASEFAMDETPDRVVVHEADVREGSERLRVAQTVPDARPPFEWLIEITSDIGESDYFKHYLVREHDIVLAQRKVLTPIDQTEAQLILHDLQVGLGWLDA